MKDIRYFKVKFESDIREIAVYYRFYTIYYTKVPNDAMIQVWDKEGKEWQRTRFDTVLTFTNWIKGKGNPIEEITWGQWQSELMIEELVS